MFAEKLNWSERDAGQRLTIIMLGMCCLAFFVYSVVFLWADVQLDGQLKPVSVSFLLIISNYIAFRRGRSQHDAR